MDENQNLKWMDESKFSKKLKFQLFIKIYKLQSIPKA